MRYMIICVILFLFLPTALLYAQEEKDSTQTEESDKIPLALDYARFRYADSLTYLELYGTFPRSLLNYIDSGDRLMGEFIVTAEVFDQDSLLGVKKWKSVNYADSLGDINIYQRLYFINDFVLEPGKYNVKIALEDINSSRFAEHTFPVEITDFAPGALKVSDIEISSQISRDTTKSIFNKNNFKVMPHPTGMFGLSIPILYMYSEVYNLSDTSDIDEGEFVVSYKIYDADGQMVKQVNPQTKRKAGSSAVEVNKINVATLVSGPYKVIMEIEDLSTGQKVATGRRFFVYREEDYKEGGEKFQKTGTVTEKGSPGLDADRYDSMQKNEIEQEFKYTRYINSKEERKTFKKLDLQGKRKFIKEFWANRDQTPTTPINEFKRDYLRRVRFANQKFKGTFRDGWKTDRGRVLLLYGHPDEVERHPFSADTKAYEIWYYYSVEGGVEFYFVDRRDLGDLELVHSTARGELYDPGWTRYLEQN